jgi:hypothetical protein
MKRRELLRSSAAALVLVLVGCTTPAGRSQTTGTVGVQTGPRGTTVSAGITVGQARELAVANRMTGYGGLPPGIRRNLARGKPLPPGIARRNMTDGMLRGLPVVQGHEWRVAGTDLVLIALGTLLVVEILQDVFR